MGYPRARKSKFYLPCKFFVRSASSGPIVVSVCCYEGRKPGSAKAVAVKKYAVDHISNNPIRSNTGFESLSMKKAAGLAKNITLGIMIRPNVIIAFQ